MRNVIFFCIAIAAVAAGVMTLFSSKGQAARRNIAALVIGVAVSVGFALGWHMAALAYTVLGVGLAAMGVSGLCLVAMVPKASRSVASTILLVAGPVSATYTVLGLLR